MGRKECTLSMLKPGDHIKSNRIVIVYHHHGIYVGPDTVVHFVGPAKRSNPSIPCERCGYTPSLHLGIVRTCMNCFLDGHSLYRVDYSADCKPADEVVKTAMEFFQRIRSFGNYNLLSNNCEHFATFCKTGKKSCKEIMDTGIKITTTVVWISSVIGVFAHAYAKKHEEESAKKHEEESPHHGTF